MAVNYENLSHLSEILSAEEMSLMSDSVRIKLESHLRAKQLSINDMNTRFANSLTVAEKENIAVDRELQNYKSKLSLAEDFGDKLRKQLRETEEALQKSRHEYYDTLECKESLTYELNIYKERADRFSQEKLDMTELLDRRLEEIKCLQMEIKHLSSRLQLNSEGRIESSIKSEEIELRMLSMQHQEMRMSQERQLYQKQIATLNDELNQKVSDLSTLRRERAIQLFELQSNFEQKSEEHFKSIEEVKHLKLVLDKKDKHIDSLATRMREMQQYCAQLEEDYQNELSAQSNLVELHKQSSEDFKMRNESLIQTIEEMQKLLQSAKVAHTELEATFNEAQLKYSEQLNKCIEENNLLRKELEDEKANTSRESLEEEVEKYFPAAAATNKILRNNVSLSYIYSEYVRVQQELEDVKSENNRLKENMQSLVTEAEENAPLLNRKIQEHQRALQTISDLQNQISLINADREQWAYDKESLARINNQFQREINRFEIENLDLVKQINHLIKSVEEARGFKVFYEQDTHVTSTDETKRGIPDSMITFRNIEELQAKNQQLIKALREANERIQNFEKDNDSEQRSSLEKNLDNALLQLEQLRAERRQQTEMVEALAQQRDLYKMMANHSNDDDQQRSPIAYSFNQSVRINKNEINEMNQKFEKLEKEYSGYREESTKRLKESSNNSEKFREELSASKIECAKLSSELTFTRERLQMFKTNMEQFQRENGLLRERNTVLNENIKKLEQNVVLMRNDILASQEKEKRLEISNENLKAERDLYRNNELKLLQEKEIIIRDNENQNRLISTYQSIQSSVSKMESDTINSLKAQLEKSDKECVYLRNIFEKDQIKDQMKTKEFDELSLKFETIDAENTALREELKHWQIRSNTSPEQLNKISSEDLKRQNEEKSKLIQQVNNLEQDLNKVNSEAESLKNARRFLETQMQNAKSELDSKQAEITKLSAQINAFQTDIDSAQKTIIQLRKVARKYKMQYDEMKVEFDQIKDSQSAADSETVENKQYLLNVFETEKAELLKKIDELNDKVGDLEQQIEKLMIELSQVSEEKEKAKEQAIEKEEKAKKIAQQAKIRIASLTAEKMNLFKTKEIVEKSSDELRDKMKILEQNAEESALRLASFKSQYDAKMSRQERELTEAYKQIEELKSKMQTKQQIQQTQQQQTSTIGVTIPVQTSSQSSINPVRHSVHPQQSLSAKSTPTASIKPLAFVVTHGHRSTRTASVTQSRSATVATVQPTTEDGSHQTVPHATVQPIVTPTANAEQTESITAVNNDDSAGEQNEQNIDENIEPQTNVIDQNIDSLELSAPFQECSSESNFVQEDYEKDVTEIDSEDNNTQVKQELSEPSSSTSSSKDKIILKRVRKLSEEMSTQFSTKKSRSEGVECEGVQPNIEPNNEPNIEENIQYKCMSDDKPFDDIIQPSNNASFTELRESKQNDYDDDEIIILSDESDEERAQSEREEEEVEEEEDMDEEEEDYDEEQGEDASEVPYEEPEDFIDNGSADEEEDVRDEQSDDNRIADEDVEIIGISRDIQENEFQERDNEMRPTGSHQLVESGSADANVVTPTVEVNVVSSVEVTPIRHNQPFIQIPIPIQRSFGPLSGRQSFYHSHNTQPTSYDEGECIVPSTPTLFVPRRDDSFAESLNSPRVPQGRFVFSSTVPEASNLSQLATEGTLGMDDTNVDLSQFDDSGRNVPTTPLPIMPLTDNLVQSADNSELQFANDQNLVTDAPLATHIDAHNINESRFAEIDEENSKTSSKDNSNVLESGIETSETQPQIIVHSLDEGVSEQEESDSQEKPVSEIKDEDIQQTETSIPSTSSSHNAPQRQVARRGRGFGTQRVLQRRPIVWSKDSLSQPNTSTQSSQQSQQHLLYQSQQQTQQQQQQQQQSQQPSEAQSQQVGRRIRLRGASSKFSAREVYRGNRGGRGGRGSRGGYHYQ